jgi:hypothetical protein
MPANIEFDQPPFEAAPSGISATATSRSSGIAPLRRVRVAGERGLKSLDCPDEPIGKGICCSPSIQFGQVFHRYRGPVAHAERS